ncbi:hypothetical protein [Micromonospora rubida]
MSEAHEIQGFDPSTKLEIDKVGSPDVEAVNPRTDTEEAFEEARTALMQLAASNPDLATSLSRIVTAIATEAARSKRLTQSLLRATQGVDQGYKRTKPDAPERRGGRRNPGAFDPISIFAEHGEEGLRERLAGLSIEQLRDIIAEQGMDHDRLAMKWKDRTRLSDRIVERVLARSVKGEVFRSP